MENVLVLIVVYALDDLGSDERGSCHDTLEGDHVVQVVGRQRPRVACVETKASRPGAVVERFGINIGAWNSADDLLEGVVEGERPVEGVEEEALSHFRVVIADMVNVDYQPPLLLLYH